MTISDYSFARSIHIYTVLCIVHTRGNTDGLESYRGIHPYILLSFDDKRPRTVSSTSPWRKLYVPLVADLSSSVTHERVSSNVYLRAPFCLR